MRSICRFRLGIDEVSMSAIILFLDVDEESLKNVLIVLRTFELVSGMKVNLSKCSMEGTKYK